MFPDASEGDGYKYEVHGADGHLRLKADPFAFHAEVPPKTASRIYTSRYEWGDDAWIKAASAQYRKFVYLSEVLRLGGTVTN